MSEPTVLTVYGTVSTSGEKIAGHGFTSVSIGNGQFSINFDEMFSEAPSIVGSQVRYGNTDESTLDNIIFPIVSASSALAITGDGGGKHTPRNFSFIAMGNKKS